MRNVGDDVWKLTLRRPRDGHPGEFELLSWVGPRLEYMVQPDKYRRTAFSRHQAQAIRYARRPFFVKLMPHIHAAALEEGWLAGGVQLVQFATVQGNWFDPADMPVIPMRGPFRDRLR